MHSQDTTASAHCCATNEPIASRALNYCATLRLPSHRRIDLPSTRFHVEATPPITENAQPYPQVTDPTHWPRWSKYKLQSICSLTYTYRHSPTDTIIQLVVPSCAGETVHLNVHRGVLCKSSGFLQNAIKPEWTAREENVITLPEDSANTVIDYIKWLYYDKIAIKLYEAGDDKLEKKAEEAEKVFCLLAEAYIFGEKIIDTQYKNAVVKAILDAQRSSRWSMGPESVSIVYEGTPSGSPVRRIIADRFAYSAYDDSKDGYGWMQFIDGYPREALADAMKLLLCLRKSDGRPEPGVESYLE